MKTLADHMARFMSRVADLVEEIRTRIVKQLGTCRVAVLNDPCTVSDFRDGVAPVVTRIISEAQTNIISATLHSRQHLKLKH